MTTRAPIRSIGMAVATDARRSQLLMPNEPLSCPHGHHVKQKVWALGGDALTAYRCAYRDAPSTDECDAAAFVLGGNSGIRVMWHVTIHELHEMEERHLTIKGIRDYLGLRWAA